MPTQCSQEELDFGTSRRAHTCGRFRRRGDHVERWCAAARRGRPRDPVPIAAGASAICGWPTASPTPLPDLLRQRIFEHCSFGPFL